MKKMKKLDLIMKNNIEQKIISILLKFPEHFEKIYNIGEGLFYNPCCRNIFFAMKELYESGNIINLNSVSTISNETGPSKLNEIYDLELTDANFKLYFEQLETQMYKNKIKELSVQIENAKNKNEIITGIESLLEKTNVNDFKISTMKELAIEYMENKQNKNDNDIIDVDIPFFTNSGFLFRKKEVVVIAGRPTQGKTTYAVNIASRLAKSKYAGAIITTEQTEQTLFQKKLAINTNIGFNRIERYDFTKVQEIKLAQNLEKEVLNNLYFIDKGRINDIQIEQAVKKLKYKYNIDFLIIDYLQRLKWHNEKLSRFERVSNLSNFMKEIAKEYNLLLFELAQVKRNGDNEPTMDDLKDSGDIEQDADKIIFLHEFEKQGALKSKVKHIVAKNKTGAAGEYFSIFEKDICKFTEIDNYKNS